MSEDVNKETIFPIGVFHWTAFYFCHCDIFIFKGFNAVVECADFIFYRKANRCFIIAGRLCLLFTKYQESSCVIAEIFNVFRKDIQFEQLGGNFS